jgi:hypothetical protein
MSKIKEWLIHKLGGYTSNDFKFVTQGPMQEIQANSKIYILDPDSYEYEKTQLARKIGEEMLLRGLIKFNVGQEFNVSGEKVYEVSARAEVMEI